MEHVDWSLKHVCDELIVVHQSMLSYRRCAVYMCMFDDVQEDLSRFSWYKAWMSRDEAERKVRAYKEVWTSDCIISCWNLTLT